MEETDDLYLNEGFTVKEAELLGCKADKVTDRVCYKNGEKYDCPLKDECPIDFSTEQGKKNYAEALLKRKIEKRPRNMPSSERYLTKKQLRIMASQIGLKEYEHVEDIREDTSIFAMPDGCAVIIRWHKDLEDSTALLFEHTEIKRLIEALKEAEELTSVETLRGQKYTRDEELFERKVR